MHHVEVHEKPDEVFRVRQEKPFLELIFALRLELLCKLLVDAGQHVVYGFLLLIDHFGVLD